MKCSHLLKMLMETALQYQLVLCCNSRDCIMNLTVVQVNLSATVSGCICQVDDGSGCSCQQTLVCMLGVLLLSGCCYIIYSYS